MKYYLWFLMVLFFVSPAMANFDTQMLKTLYEDLNAVDLDESRVVRIQNITFKRDVGHFFLQEGVLCFLKPVSVNGKMRTTGAIFMGTGVFSYVPPTQIEREQLARFFKVERRDVMFEILYLRFTDDTERVLMDGVTVDGMELPRAMSEEKAYCDKYFLEPRNDDVAFHLVRSLIDEKKEGCFYAHIGEHKSQGAGVVARPEFFFYNPYEEEEVQFQNRRSADHYIRQTVNQFHCENDYISQIDFSSEDKDVVQPVHYAIDAAVNWKGHFKAKVDVTLKGLRDSTHVLQFLLYPGLTVDTVTDPSGTVLAHSEGNGEVELLVFLNTPIHQGDEVVLSFVYEGDMLKQIGGNFHLKSSGLWFPRIGGGKKATFDMTFRTPQNLKFVAVGELVSEKKEGKEWVTHWVQKEPTANMSFNMGPFQSRKIKNKTGDEVTVMMSKEGHGDIARYLGAQGIASGKNMDKEVGADLVNSMAFFTHWFGPIDYKKIVATEIPAGHGEAFPGFLHLSWQTFQVSDKWGYNALFRAHEAAHMWWGLTVDHKTYHDQWLSEGFATYSGLWYVLNGLQNSKDFFRILEEWRDEIFNTRNYVLGSGAESGPISLGYRTSSTETQGDFNLIVYKKGAYVLHMLRNMMMDLNTMRDDVFLEMMKDYVATYRGKEVTTEDFRRVVEKHMGEDMGWFFDQWVYGTELPSYQFAYFPSRQPDGTYLVNCEVKQENVSKDFKMYVPLTIVFEGNQLARMRVLIDGPKTSFDLPPLPMRPEKIVFNDFHSVLAEVKQ